uniref:ATP synthase CF0 B chain subunit I n=1 Tax=Nitzschia putrida TaxID=2742595 RepID=A0A7R7YP98_9STRA|nr:ATP synthase CF0 B chain subunit I [Nitzschia putrida]
MLVINVFNIYLNIIKLGIINNFLFCLLVGYLINTFFSTILRQRQFIIIKNIKKSEIYYTKTFFLFHKIKNIFSQKNIFFIKIQKEIFNIRKIFIKNRVIIIKFSLNFYLMKIIQLFKLKKTKFILHITDKINYLILKDLHSKIH